MTQWFLDFDETLVVGPVTWALQTVLPALIRDNNLPLDQAQLDAAILIGQEQAASGVGDMAILDVLFSEMNWPHDLKKQLIANVFDHYIPTVFEDTLPFLQRMGGVYVLSNNDRSPEIAAHLGLTPYIKRFYTPKLCGVRVGKPQREIWDFVNEAQDVEDATLVGDDPWSDGGFADNCEIDCIIVDRMNRFAGIAQHRRVRSLAAILDASAAGALG